MTREEAIVRLENLIDSEKKPRNQLALNMAIDDMREQEERENPKPLTLDELRETSLQEWVWISVLSPFECEQKVSAYYRRYESCGAALAARAFWCGYPGLTFGFDYVDYGKTWLAYSHKPKGV